MQFVRSGAIYKVARITGVQDNLLGIVMGEGEQEIEVIALPMPSGEKVRISPDEVLKQVLEGLLEVNSKLGKSYHLSKVFYLPHESGSNFVYKMLIIELVRRIDSRGAFATVPGS